MMSLRGKWGAPCFFRMNGIYRTASRLYPEGLRNVGRSHEGGAGRSYSLLRFPQVPTNPPPAEKMEADLGPSFPA